MGPHTTLLLSLMPIDYYVTYNLIYRQMVLYIWIGYQALGTVYLDQLKGACHTHILS